MNLRLQSQSEHDCQHQKLIRIDITLSTPLGVKLGGCTYVKQKLKNGTSFTLTCFQFFFFYGFKILLSLSSCPPECSAEKENLLGRVECAWVESKKRQSGKKNINVRKESKNQKLHRRRQAWLICCPLVWSTFVQGMLSSSTSS